jgi:ubiquinone biosynthesis protein
MARSGLRLDEETIKAIGQENARRDFWSRAALWVGALSLAALALKTFGWV